MQHKRKQLPKYCRHKPSGRAFVRIGGKMHYLGKYGSEASRREYDRIIAEFVSNGRQAFTGPDEILIEQLIVLFLNHAEKEKNYSDSTKVRIGSATRLLNELFGKQRVSDFTPIALKTLRRHFIEQGLCTATTNAYVSVVKQIFYWGGEEEIVPADVTGALRMVKALQAGQTAAIDYDPVEPVEDEIVEKTLPHLPQQYRDMVRVQRFICGRPQDIHNMRPGDIDCQKEIWKYSPYTHKTKKRGKIRQLPIGPRAQAILLPYLEKCVTSDSFVFPRRVSDYHSAYTYAIQQACKRAGVPVWTPNQLRHAGGTEVRDKFGLDHAQVMLGHASAKMTEIYAKVSFDKAAAVAKEIG
jgi:integrase